MDYASYKDALLRKRGEILAAGGGVKPFQATMESQFPPGRSRRSGQRQQRSPHSAEAQTDRRQDPAGDRRGAIPDGERHLRHLPRLRRRDCPGAAQRDSVDPRLHHLQGKTELVKSDRTAGPPARLLPRQAGDAPAPRRGREVRARLRLQQHLSVRHQPRGHARSLGCTTPSPISAARPRIAPCPTIRPGKEHGGQRSCHR